MLSAAIIVLFVTGNNKQKKNRELDERITLRRQDKIPYGTYVAYRNLKYLFPAASISVNRSEPGYWESLSNYETGQAFIAITDQFNPFEDELKRLISFAESGNDVFISTTYISASADKLLGCISSSNTLSTDEAEPGKQSQFSLTEPPFGSNSVYSYPGMSLGGYFSSIDTTTTEVLGYDKAKRPVFIHLRAGSGNFYVHLEPLAFSNYFLLHKKNISYYEKALSVINPAASKIVWDEYYLNRKSGRNREQKKSWMSVFFQYPAMRAALFTAMFTLLLYAILETRRKQRFIPIITKPKNDSLDFVKTIGRLYYDKGDHRNLSRKMGSYFLEYVRTRYKLPTGRLDDDFVQALQYKSGAEESTIRGIISFIRYADDAPQITNGELADFHKQLENFYQKT
ncbi:MAG: DUF4350 domain-containing protein [Chitinophagaceae bacterium]